jgi:hypothetical protein
MAMTCTLAGSPLVSETMGQGRPEVECGAGVSALQVPKAGVASNGSTSRRCIPLAVSGCASRHAGFGCMVLAKRTAIGFEDLWSVFGSRQGGRESTTV